MAKGSWVARVRRHQPLLHGEDQLVRGVESLRWERRVAPAKADLECADGLAQPGWRLYEVEQAKRFDVIEQDVGFRKENPSLKLGGLRHAQQVNRGLRAVKSSFTSQAIPSSRLPLSTSTFCSTGSGMSRVFNSSRHRCGWMKG